MLPRQILTIPGQRAIVAPPGSIVVYIEAGQSNSKGTQANPNADFSYTFTQAQVYWKGTNLTNNADNGSYELFELGTNTNSDASNKPDASLFVIRHLEQSLNEDVRLMQCAIASTGFTNGTGDWASGGSLRNALEKHFIKPGLSSLVSENKNIYILPFFFIQGEADSQNATNAAAYEAQLESFFSDVRTWVGIPNLPIVIPRVGNQPGYSDATTAQSAQDRLAAKDRNIHLLFPDNRYEYNADNVHFTELGYEQLANDYLKKTKEIGSRLWPGDFSVEVDTAPSLGDISATSLQVTGQTTEYSTLYVGVYADGSSNPGAIAIKNGTGSGYVANNSGGLIYSQEGIVTVNGLTGSTDYEVFAFLEDKAGNQSATISFSATTAASSGTLLFRDTFTDADDTALTAHTPETGSGWTTISGGGHKVQSNAALATGSNGSVGWVSAVDYTSAPTPTVLQATLNVNVGVPPTRIFLRTTSINEGILIQISASNDDIRYFNLISGSFSVQSISSSAGVPSSGTHQVIVEDDGSEIRAKIGSSNVASFAASYSTGNWRAGIGSSSTDSTPEYLDIEVRDVSAFTI